MNKIVTISIMCCLLASLGLQNLQAQPSGRKATILDHKDRIKIRELPILNSQFRETNLSVTPDGNYLFFMSMRGGQPWSKIYMEYQQDSVYDGDIWYARKVNGKWQRPRVMPYGINTNQGEDEPNITANGRTVYFQSWNLLWNRTGGPYYKTTRQGSEWGKMEGLGGGITEFFRMISATDGMTISADQKKFIVAAGPDYDANMDIYMSKKTRYGWTYCKKLPISTSGDERSVFLAPDGKTLYFASDGYGGFGGLDIFKATLNSDGTFGNVVNVGAPFNTEKDDYGLILTADGNEAYFVRDGNIFFADLREADPAIKPELPTITHLIRGSVRDSSSWRGLSSSVVVMDAYTGRVVKTMKTNGSGKFSFPVKNGAKVYDLVAIVDGYKKKKKRIVVAKKSYDETYTANFLLGKPQAAPPLAVVKPEPPRPEIKPEPKPEPKPDPTPAITGINKRPDKPNVSTPAIKDPKVSQVEKPEDPYDFNGVAENNLILLLDVSASMNYADKLPVLKNALRKLLEHMRQEDQISIIVYSGEARVVVEGVSAARKAYILDAIENLRSGGATKGKLALRKAYRLAEDLYISGGNNRIILATDGFFDVPDLYNIVERNASSEVCLSVFSFGKLAGYKIEQLGTLADKGKGNYSRITSDNVDMALLKEAKAVRK
ncbi:MAG: VWA domain-containing protein [Bacteroidota bacterium]